MKNNLRRGFLKCMKTVRINTFILLGIITSCLFLLLGCDAFVEVDLPSSQLAAQAVFEDKNTANAAMTNIYASIRNSGIISGNVFGISNEMGNYADELVYYGTTTNAAQDFYNNTILPTNSQISSWWSTSYNQIYAANAIIEGLKSSTMIAASDKNNLTGEALFVRALIHFYLLNIYGDIPYVITTNYQQNKLVSRMPSDTVYTHLIEDLSQSIALLPENYSTAERIRPNKSAAKALLARVYLYSGSWAEAANAASYIINNTSVYSWEENLDKIFLKESTSTIWQLKPVAEGQNTGEGETFIFTAGPPPIVALSTELLNTFESGDLRKEHWTKAVTNGTTTWYHSYKYKEQNATSTSLEYSVIFRLAEQYLIRAEARAHQGDLIGAKEDLNKIRNTAGLTATSAVSQQQILEAIRRERQVEFFTEEGHRFFDLKRTGRLDEVLAPVKPGWGSNDKLFPLPESELLLNPNLAPQNPGY